MRIPNMLRVALFHYKVPIGSVDKVLAWIKQQTQVLLHA